MVAIHPDDLEIKVLSYKGVTVGTQLHFSLPYADEQHNNVLHKYKNTPDSSESGDYFLFSLFFFLEK